LTPTERQQPSDRTSGSQKKTVAAGCVSAETVNWLAAQKSLSRDWIILAADYLIISSYNYIVTFCYDDCRRSATSCLAIRFGRD
jgi:hypothetical protein